MPENTVKQELTTHASVSLTIPCHISFVNTIHIENICIISDLILRCKVPASVQIPFTNLGYI